jgi:hypothetical protein
MCSVCEFRAAQSFSGEPGAASPSDVARDRQHRLAVLEAVLAGWGIRVTPSHGGALQLAASGARTVLVRDPAEVWSAAEALIGQRIDPLDLRVIALP